MKSCQHDSGNLSLTPFVILLDCAIFQ